MGIKVATSGKALSALGGIHFFEQLSKQLRFENFLWASLPKPKIATKATPYEKYRALILGLVSGADSLDDMRVLGKDEAFASVNGTVNAPSTYGDFLRSFSGHQCKELGESLTKVALQARKALFPKEKDFILDLDSTPNVQSGQKMEGVTWNYKNLWCLDSLQAYDNLGFCYWNEVRPGNTFTSNGAPSTIHSIFKHVPKGMNRYFRADSGYCNAACFNAAMNASAKFVITMRANMYEPLLKYAKNWHPAPKDILFKDDKDREVEIGTAPYFPKGLRGGRMLRVIFLRSPKEGEQGNSLFNDDRYEYVAWVTNMGEHEMSNAKVVRFARGRANCENFIREMKNGFDLKHLPCRALIANKAYGLAAAFAYNLVRFAGHLIDPKKPRFAKYVRFRMVNLACQVVKHARSTTLRFSETIYKEVTDWLTTTSARFGYG